MIKAIFFDLDGTLADTLPVHKQAWKDAVKQLTGKSLSDDDIDPIIDLNMDDKIKTLIHHGIITKEQAHDVGHLKEKLSLSGLKKHFAPNPSIKALLAKLKQMGYKVGLVSNANRVVVDLFRAMTGLEDYFDVVLSKDDVEHGKPNPAPYIKACSAVKVKPKNALAFEDSQFGIDSALKAGIKVVKVSSPKDIKTSFIFESIVRSNLS